MPDRKSCLEGYVSSFMKSAMIIGIHPDKSGNESYSTKWAEALEQRGVHVRWVNLLAGDALNQVAGCDGVMCRWMHNPHHKQSLKCVLYVIEQYLGLPVFPDTSTCWHYDEKISQYYLLQAVHAPTPEIWLFWDRKAALEWSETAPYPVVFKLSSGASALGVLKVRNKKEARKLIQTTFERGLFPMTLYRQPGLAGFLRRMAPIGRRFKDGIDYICSGRFPPLTSRWWKPEYGYAYFQEFLPDNPYDTRVTVIGDRAFAMRRINRPNDFRASGSGDFHVEPELIDPECLRIAFDLSNRGQFTSMSYDFLYDQKRQVLVSEISYNQMDQALFKCPGHWDSDLNWHEGQMWPEEAQAEDFISRVIGHLDGSNVSARAKSPLSTGRL